ncbi:LOW QUALITY PROTEIN: 26S proteasome non-ATPase regulatory subunit 1-like [Haliotis rubra]|uniref:LOW QUALITY PROTEIN: 26S proteasome non-ATPase regulatory subunit 1-like n=1 Tax=Haliotis rubra TaxID=36100 RepID=UPI001EE5B1B6|nr:LOW QUALITY PROTEIN: 26S proteasome non-ATPase regulatory subunit 1-like [Haliotis rubra]
MKMNITSAGGVLSLLDEQEPQLKVFALDKLNKIVDVFWAEISESVDKIEVLYEDATFKNREMAALVASKVYYHLGAFEESLTYALGAGDLFNVNDTSEFVETTIAKCIDHYTKQCVENAECSEEDRKPIDPRLEAVVNRMFQRCFDDKQFKQALGISLETRRIDIFEQSILKSDDIPFMLSYAFKVCMALIQNRQFRCTILKVLTKLYMSLETADYINVCQCYIFLDDPQSVADILEKLIKGDEDSVLMSYQIAFDLYESATQQFLQQIQSALRAAAPIPIVTPDASKKKEETSKETKEEPKEGDSMETEEAAKPAPPVPDISSLSESDKLLQDKLTKIHTILGGETTIYLHLQFLIKNNKSDLLILKNTKDAVRNSVCHSATVIANSFMHCGTTSDQFLRDNLDWLSRATNWAKFTATASLGVIHKGHEKEALQLMSSYLPKDTSPGSSYSEGGGLFALGLIHANHGGEITDYLLNQLKDASTDMVRHGGCLGVGLAAMGTARQDIYEQLKFNLYQDDAVTGEAAGLAMGLVMLGTKSATAIEDMVAYAQETQHEKILRGLAVGISLTMYGRLEEADALIESLTRDKDPILRWSGMNTIAMAYCGSGNNQAIRKLLHVAVSDVNDDVRRVAVTALGFLLFRTPEQCPSVVSLLSESYNPHVRFGAAMALGIACAGTGLKEAMTLLEPMVQDPINYVRQGALIASALILVQQNEVTCPKVTHFRQLYAKVISDKHEDVMAKFGAILAQGIIDAGGRNATVSLQSRTGHTNMEAVVGLLVFCQYWFWYPLTHFLSLSFTPNCVVGLNSDLKMPKIEFKSNAKPSTFAYPPPLEEKSTKTKEKVETAVLSITAKQKKKDAEKQKDEKMEVDEEKKDEGKEKDVEMKEEKPEAKKKESDKKDDKKEEKKEEEKEKEEKEKKEKEPEPTFEMMANPARVMKSQLKVLSMGEEVRYTPVKDLTIGGIVMMKNTKPGEDEEIVETVAAGGPKIEEEEEPEPPEPFEWTED